MKKLRLIIPLFSFQSTYLKSIIFIILLSIITQFCYAQEHRYGCLLNGYSFIFNVPDVSHGGSPNFLFSTNANNNPDSYYHIQDRCPDFYNQSPCAVYNYDGSFKGNGILADFSVDYCPLDDYAHLLFIFTALIAYFVLQRPKKQWLKINENIPHYHSL